MQKAFNFSNLSRLARHLALCALLVSAWPVMAQPVAQATSGVVDVYKSPLCGCCEAWAKHLQKNGFTVVLQDVNDVPATRKKLGMPDRFGSCHTAKVGNYLIEGQVPAADIKQLIRSHPNAIGLAAPGMPPDAPGMDGKQHESYDTLLVMKDDTTSVFKHH